MKTWLIPVVGILVLGGLEALALSKGINGQLFSVACGAIGVIAGGGTVKAFTSLRSRPPAPPPPEVRTSDD